MRGCACRGTAGFAHVSCLAEQAKILVAEAQETNWGDAAFAKRFNRWNTCSLCEQMYHGVVLCALGWACWKTYLARPETAGARFSAMTQLGNGLFEARHYEEACSVQEADLATRRRLGAPEYAILISQTNLASTYGALGRLEEALRLRREAYSGCLRLHGAEHDETSIAAINYANSLFALKRVEEAKSVLRKNIPVARRVLGESHELTLKMRLLYAGALYADPAATLDDLCEAVTTLDELQRTARRVLGGAYPLTGIVGRTLLDARRVLRARETPTEASSEARPTMHGFR